MDVKQSSPPVVSKFFGINVSEMVIQNIDEFQQKIALKRV